MTAQANCRKNGRLLPAFLLILLSGSAFADERPPAIRIEVKDPSAGKRAVALEKALRKLSAVKSRPHKVGVTHELVGQLDRRGARYTLTLALIDTSTHKRVRSLRETATEKTDVRRWAAVLLAKLLDEGTGELVLVANARRGYVLVDGQVVTELYEGRATIAGLALGTHEVAIRAVGYKPFSVEIEIDGRNEQSFLLEAVTQ